MIAAPIGLIAERRVVSRLMRAGAVSVETAQPLNGLRRIQQRRLKRLLDAGVVHQPQVDRYYLDAPALADRLAARRQRAVILLAVVLVMMAVLVYFAKPAIRS